MGAERLVKRVRVVDTTFAVVVRQGVTGDDGEAAHGYTDLDRTEIQIDRDGSPERQRWALIHELAHAVMHETGLLNELTLACGAEKALAIEEDITRRFVPAMVATLKSAEMIK